jgi:putative tryptophan/tyrosine transport system substrate-binding protein
MAIDIRRREFIAGLGGTAFTWPLAARAQQSDRVRRIGVLMNVTAENPEGQPAVAAFQQELQKLGWSDSRKARIDIRWGANDVDLDRKYAAELVALASDVVLAAGTLGVTALQRATRTLPIVFVRVTDPVGAGVVDTLGRPSANVTGFMNYEYSSSGKWLELLKQIVPKGR